MKIFHDQTRRKTRAFVFWGASVALLIALSGYVYSLFGSASPSYVEPAIQRRNPAETYSPSSVGSSVQPASSAVAGVPQATQPQGITDRGELLSKMIRSGKPDEAYTAYQIISRCISARAYAVNVAAIADPATRAVVQQASNEQEQCRGISAGQLTQQAMLLVRAAEGLIPGAFEQLPVLADDPLIAEAAPRLIDAYVKAAVPVALISQYQYAIQCSDPPECASHDPERALMLWTAYRVVKGLAGEDSLTTGLSKELGSQRARIAVDKGKALVAESRTKS